MRKDYIYSGNKNERSEKKNLGNENGRARELYDEVQCTERTKEKPPVKGVQS